jgi:anti-anti-sigma factor
MKQSQNGAGKTLSHVDDWAPPRVRDAIVPGLPDPLAVRSLRVGDLLLVEAEGRLDARTVSQLTGALQAARGVGAVLVDLSELTVLDTIAADALLTEHARLAAAGAGMALLCPEGEVRRALELTGVTDVVSAFADPNAALDAASGQA